MSWTKGKRGPLAALAVCVLLPLGAAACTGGEAHGGTVASSPVGKVLDETDDTGRNLREVSADDAPQVGLEVTPDPAGGWDVRLAFRHFRCSAPTARPAAVTGRGFARLFVDGRGVARLHGTAYHLAAGVVPRGTHEVTARLYADDGTVWAVRGKPVESTADITVSDAEAGTPDPPAASPRS
ncbi:hypothetical protein [Streptomyces capoamus]|uniref:Lipoprotein n=1 Tax=Streptomyces capoamus TaxID=68183 RepID=A0A919KF39_9ACTN|nr:hypothetical protein [Streptomyces capoamus]GGW19335.1 hypothetical protein GCM10010501_54910 [Streptomyces libani subsp. rufus]GHG71514.1 hypothetical protein GCM10018980_66880 [Streptomyces capoamus]